MRRRPPRHAQDPSVPPEARVLALRLLGRRDYTTTELRARLLTRGCRPEDVEHTLGRLAEQGALDDRRAASSHVRLSTHVKGRGPRRVRLELAVRGVPPDVAVDALSQVTDADQDDAIRRFLSRRPAPVTQADRNRLLRQLVRRGFELERARRLLALDPDIE
jgi:regulatory protein